MVDYIAGKATGSDGSTTWTPGSRTPVRVKKVYFDYGSVQIYRGSIVQYKAAADPKDGFVKGPGVDVEVLAAVTGLGKAKIAGVVVDLGETNGTEDGWITIETLIPGEVYTFAVAVGIATGEGLKLANNGAYCDDSGAFAVTDAAYALFTEDDANNPYGTSALTAAIGLVDAIWTLYDLQDTA